MRFMRKMLGLGAVGVVLLGVLLPVAGAGAVINEEIIQLGEEFQVAVSPMYVEVELQPGQTSAESFRVRNAGTEETDLLIGVKALDFASETTLLGTPRNEILQWTDLEVSQCDAQRAEGGDLLVHLRVREECFVELYVATPVNAPFGEQYMSVFFQEYVRDGGGGMQMVRSIGTNVYGTNRTGGGEGDACGVVSGQRIPFWLFGGVLDTTAVVENCGRLNFHTAVKLEVRGVFGNLVYEETQPADRIIPAESRRELADSWGETSMGIFRVKQSVEVLGETYVVEGLVFIVPIWLLLVIFGCIAVAVVAFVCGRKKNHVRLGRR